MIEDQGAGTRHPEGGLNREPRNYHPSLAGDRHSASGVVALGHLAGLLCLIAIYFITTEQGATALFSGTDIHEFVHDGRHLLGFPCH